MAKVKVTVAIFRKILSSLHVPHLLSNLNITSHYIGYDYTTNKFAFQHDRVKVKVAVTVFRKTLQLKACQASKGKKSY